MRNRTALLIADLAEWCFSYSLYSATAPGKADHRERTDWFADFLFEIELNADLVQYARRWEPQRGAVRGCLLNFWESYANFSIADADERDRLFRLIAEQLLVLSAEEAPRRRAPNPNKQLIADVVSALELEGYRYDSGKLQRLDENAFDVQEASTLLERLYSQVGLPEAVRFVKSLRNVDEHYQEQRWGDCIKHARDLLETALTEALRACAKSQATEVKATTYHSAGSIRDKLESLGFLNTQENQFLKALYSLLSQQGGHANVSQKDHALMCRQHALTAVHFVLLRCEHTRSGAPE